MTIKLYRASRKKFRSTRLEKNLTIQQLATRTHVSKGLLSKIENSRTIPSLPVFVTLIQSLEISLKEFFQDMVLANGKNYLLVKKDQYAPLERALKVRIKLSVHPLAKCDELYHGNSFSNHRIWLKRKTLDHQWLQVQLHSFRVL